MATPINHAAVDRLIQRHIKQFRNKGVYTLRPGYKFVGGWITDKPAVVATVDKKLAGLPPRNRLPTEIEDVPVDVREATGLQRLRAQDPVQHALVTSHGRAEHQEPTWKYERDVATGATLSAAKKISHPALVTQGKKPEIPYSPAATPLDPVTETMTVIAHASPDAGWPVLRDFLSQTQSRLTVGMYDFTSKHILDTLQASLKTSGASLELVLDHPPRNPSANQTDDQTKSALESHLKAQAKIEWALTRNDPVVDAWVFPTAYHIKVAVKDGQVFWLSSGNWNNSNQPDLSSKNPADGSFAQADRDWHVVVMNPMLAGIFEAYLRHDRQIAAGHQGVGNAAIHQALHKASQALQVLQAHSSLAQVPPSKPSQLFEAKTFVNVPVTIQPVLTPDTGSYVGNILELLRSATRSIYMQTQYIHPSDQPADKDFTTLITTLRDKHRAGLDVRVITSQYENTAQWIEKLKEYDLDAVLRIQNRVHNKGIVVDSKVVALGSQNWSGDGTLRNRDATVIIHQEGIAQYFEQIFLHDWTTLASAKVVDASHPSGSTTKRGLSTQAKGPNSRKRTAPRSRRKAPPAKRKRQGP